LGVRGYGRGLLREGMEAAFALGGVAAAFRFYPVAGERLSAQTGLPSTVLGGIAFVAIAVSVTAIGFFLAGWLDRRLTRAGGAQLTNGMLGAVFGVLKAGVYASIAVLLASRSPLGSVIDLLEGSLFSRTVLAVFPA